MVEAQVTIWNLTLMWLVIAVLAAAIATLCWVIAWRDMPKSDVRRPPARRRLEWIDGEYREVSASSSRAIARR